MNRDYSMTPFLMSQASRAAELALVISTLLWSISFLFLPFLIYIIGLFRKSKCSNYPLVFMYVYLAVTRVLVIKHVVFLKMDWAPDSSVKLIWALYYLGLFGLFLFNIYNFGKLWERSGWIVRLLGIGILITLAVSGFKTIYTPYSILLK